MVAGDICAIGRLPGLRPATRCPTRPTHWCSSRGRCPSRCCRWRCSHTPRPTRTSSSVGLQRLAAEDPTLRIEQNPETHQIVLWCMGEAHSGVVLDALARRYGVAVDTVELRVPLRETFGGKAKGHGRHVKQSGGHGQYAVCDIEVEPLPEGSGFEFVDKVVGGSVPRQFIPSVEKGVRAQMEKGVGRRLSRSSTSGSHCSTARRTASTRRTSPSRWQAALALREAAARDQGEPARARGRGVGAGARRPGRRGDERPGQPSRPGARHREGRRGPHRW